MSYTYADRAWAEWIAWVLEEDGHRVLVQAWDFVPGGNWIQGMHTGTRDAARTIAVLSAEYLDSAYGTAEWQAAWAADPDGTKRKLLVVRVQECGRPGLLAGMTGMDMVGLGEAAARARLREMIASAVAGRAKPGVAPGFPGRAVPREPHFPGSLPRVWKVPARNPRFTGRRSELRKLTQALAGGSEVIVQSVHGMGGVGKSALAAEYAHAHAAEYDVVWQIAAQEPALIADQFTALATRLGLEAADDPDRLRDQVHDELRAVPGWLLIFDNADGVDAIAPWLPSAPMPAGVLGHVILTTRRGGFGVLGPVLDLDVMAQPAAVRLLRSRARNLDRDTAEQIADELGRLPLALEQAAAYLDRSQIPGAEYLGLLRGRAADLHVRGQVTGRTDSIATVWDISLLRISGESPAAVQLLDVCAWLAPEPILLDLFTTHPDLLPEPLSSSVSDPLAFADVVAVLADYSLAQRTSAGLQLHRLVQAAIRARQHPSPPPPQQDTMTPGAAAGPVPGASHPLAVALRLLNAATPEEIESAPQTWPRLAVLLPHILAATGHLEDADVGPDPQMLADGSSVLGLAGTYLWVHARHADAKVQEERALAIDEAAYGPDHPDVARDLNNLALTLRAMGQATAARPLQERALAIDEAAYGPDHPEVARDLNSLALILQDMGQAEAARPLQERALAIDEAAYGPDHPTVARRLNNLAQILLDLGQSGEARPLQERALSIIETALGPGHLRVAAHLNNLAVILRDLGRSGEARPHQERALAIYEAAYGPDHPDVATGLNNLALTLRDLGLAGEARSLQERALAIDEAAYGPDHPDVARDLNNLAQILRDLGLADEARPRQERALAIDEAASGPDHPNFATDLNNLALILRDLGLAREARPLQERALAIDEAVYGPDHPTVARDLNNLAQILRDLGQSGDARSL